MNTPHLLTTKIFFPWQLGLQLKSFCINESQTIRGLFCVRKTHMLCHVSWQPSALWLQLPQCQAQHDTVHACLRACVRVSVCLFVCERQRKKESEQVRERLCLHDLTFVSHSVSGQPCPIAGIKLPFYILHKKIMCASHSRVCVCTCICVCFANIPCETKSIAHFHSSFFNVLFKGFLSYTCTYTHKGTIQAFMKHWRAHPAFSVCFSVTKRRVK